MELRKALFNISSLADLGEEITSEKNFQEKLQSLLHVVLGTFLTSKGAIAGRASKAFLFPTSTSESFLPREETSHTVRKAMLRCSPRGSR
jgi:hypothetical protein